MLYLLEMRMKTFKMKFNFKSFFWGCLLFTLISCNVGKYKQSSDDSLQLIPKPNSVKVYADSLDITSGLTISAKGVSDEQLQHLKNYLRTTALPLSDNGVKLELLLSSKSDTLSLDEGYEMKVDKNSIIISVSSEVGLFYGLQTLIQLTENGTKIPLLEISDAPRFLYRGLHLDVSRHFLSLDFLKKQIDMMAYFKLNHFHWHLTDGPGWRLEIKKYPELTNIAAWRTHELWIDWWATSPRKYVQEGTLGAYGGYYTQDEARELVRYAAERHITIIPEIEMPGHSEEVLAVYPQLACTEKPYTSSEFCIGNDETFEFLENVLSEVVDIFPSKYIHIGGDEADKKHWKECPKCQARIKDEGLKDEAELQSYLVRRIEKFLHSKDRILVGWDEILEGGLDKSAVVMAWRGEKIGIDAVRDGHNVIMSPDEFCYFDSYQGMPDTQPEAIGGFLPIEKVYSYNPVPDTLNADEMKRVLGVQANLWAEYIPSEKHMEYMMYPRLLALAEVAWTQPENKSWNEFKVRVNKAIPALQRKGYNTYTLSKEPFVTLKKDTENKAITVELTSELFPVDIFYTTDGSNPNTNSHLYSAPVLVKDSAILKAQLYRNGVALGDIVQRRIDYHKAIDKKVIYNTPFSQYYPAGGETALIDGLPGGLSHGDGLWQGFMLPELDIVIDLQEETSIQSVRTRFLQNANAWIWLPAKVTFLASIDGKEFHELTTLTTSISKDEPGTLFQPFSWSGAQNARYIRLKATSNGTKGGWMFLDEIIVW